MTFGLLLLILFSNSLSAQKAEDLFIFHENISNQYGFSPEAELHHLLIDSIPFRQEVITRHFSVEPHHYYYKNNLKYAVWDKNQLEQETEIRVATIVKLLDFDLNKILSTNNKDLNLIDRNQHLSSDKYLEVNNRKIKKIAKTLEKSTELETIEAIFDFVLDTLSYKRFNYSHRGAKRALKTGQGDCTEYAELFITLSRSLDIPSRYVIGYSLSGKNSVYFHNWVEVYTKELGWICLDPTIADSGTKRYFEDLPNMFISVDYNRDFNPTFLQWSDGTRWQDVSRSYKYLYSAAVELYNDRNLESAIYFFDLLIQNDPNNKNYYNYKGMALARLGRYEEALANLQHCLRLSTLAERNSVLYSFANFFALKGDKEKCLSYLRAAIKEGFNNYEYMKTDEDLKSIWEEPEFKKLIERAK